MKKSLFELIVALLIIAVGFIQFYMPVEAFPYLMSALALVLIVAAVIRYFWIYEPLYVKFTNLKSIHDILVESHNKLIREQMLLASELESSTKSLVHYKGLSRDFHNNIKELQGTIISILSPSLDIVRERPTKGTSYLRIYQGKDQHWYFSLVGPKGKYVFNGKSCETDAEAIHALLDVVVDAKDLVLFDENGCFPSDMKSVSKDIMEQIENPVRVDDEQF